MRINYYYIISCEPRSMHGPSPYTEENISKVIMMISFYLGSMLMYLLIACFLIIFLLQNHVFDRFDLNEFVKRKLKAKFLIVNFF